MKYGKQPKTRNNLVSVVKAGLRRKKRELPAPENPPQAVGHQEKETYQISAQASFVLPQTVQSENDRAFPNAGGFNLLAGVDVSRPRPKFGHVSKWFKVIAILIPVLWGYQQYLEGTHRSRIDQAEQDLRIATDQLASNSPGITTSGVRSVYDLAFRELPVEPSSSWYSPPVNLVSWLAGRRERRLLERSRNLFREFAAAPRIPTEEKKDVVSTALLKIAIEWAAKENLLLGKSPQDPSLWLLYRAKLGKAYAPSLRLEGVQFYDADLNHATLNSGNLTNAYLEESNLEGAGLESCNLTNANLIKANLKNAKLNFARFESAKLQQADLTGADLTLAVMTNANLQAAKLTNATLRTADVQRANFADADLSGANFSQANIRGADFTGANLSRTDFRFVTGITEVKSWRGALLDGARWPSNFSPPTKESPQ